MTASATSHFVLCNPCPCAVSCSVFADVEFMDVNGWIPVSEKPGELQCIIITLTLCSQLTGGRGGREDIGKWGENRGEKFGRI